MTQAGEAAVLHGAEAPMEDWPPRPWILAGLLALAGLLIHFLFDGTDPAPLEAAGTGFLFFGSLCAAFALGPTRIAESAVFALLAGLVMGGLAYNTMAMDDALAGEEFAFAAGIFATVIALPLFQASFHRTRFRTSYALAHFHVWTDAVSAAGALAFTGLSWLLLVLLNGLFGLVGIDLLGDLMDKAWFGWMWSGGAFGTALGVLRNNLKVIGALQNVVLIVLPLLAVPLALGLVVFLVALLASGGQALWDATDAATPVLLACALGCFVLACAILREDDAAMPQARLLRVAALVLGAGIFPLAVFAAVSMGIRIGQHGLTPERIWALVCIVIATAYGLAYWVALGRGWRGNWAARLRDANLHLAAASCVMALLLALPLVDFGGISARSQVARLDAGQVSAADFDYDALRWDFGDAGRAVLDDLAARGGEVGRLAQEAKDRAERIGRYGAIVEPPPTRESFDLRVIPDSPERRAMVLDFLVANRWLCETSCAFVETSVTDGGEHVFMVVREGVYDVEAVTLPRDLSVPREGDDPPAAGFEVEIRPFSGRRLYVDGKPMGDPFE